MASISASEIKALRERTGAGTKDCTQALTENAGDMDAAFNWLQKKGLASDASKAGGNAHATGPGCQSTASVLKGLTGPQKAGALMMAIGEDRAAKLFGMMEEEELKELSQAMSTLGTVNSKTIEALFVDFASVGLRHGFPGRFLYQYGKAAGQDAGRRKGRRNHGGHSRSRRPHHVGQAQQRG